MTATVIPFPARSDNTPAATVEDQVQRYTRVASNIVDAADANGMDPKVLAATIAMIATTREEQATEPVAEEPRVPVADPSRRGFVGSKYTEQWRDVADIARDYRQDVKAARKSGELELPAHARISVTCEKYSMGQSINVRIKGLAPEELWNTPGTGWAPSEDDPSREVYNGGSTPLRAAAEAKLRELLQAYNRDNSDPMTDYYDVRFHGDVTSAHA